MNILKYKKTIFGFSIMVILLVVSFLYPLYGPKDFHKVRFLYDHKGNLIGAAPRPPSAHNPLGSDRNGADILDMLIYGAKFTILMAFSVTFFRVVIGGILGIVMSLWLKRFLPIVKDFLSVFNVVPPIIITLFLMAPVAGRITETAVTGYMKEDMVNVVLLYQMIVLVIMGIPSVLIMTAEIIDKLKNETFIESSYLMGASHFHVLKTHLKPFLKSYGLLMSMQHLINTLVLMMFLGAFGIYIGGMSQEEVVGLDTPNSLTKEWAGLIGQNYGEFYRSPWIVFDPLICYFFLILIINMIKRELESAIDHNGVGLIFKKKNANKKKPTGVSKKISTEDFTLQRKVN